MVAFKNGTQNFITSDSTYAIPVVRTRNLESPATVKWRTKKSQRFDLSGALKFAPGETQKDIVIEPNKYPTPVQPETFQVELFDPSNATVGDLKTTNVIVTGEDSLNKFIAEQKHRAKDLMNCGLSGITMLLSSNLQDLQRCKDWTS